MKARPSSKCFGPKLGTLLIVRIPFEVFEASVDDYPALSSAYGHCDYANFRIVVRKDMPDACFVNTLAHEAQHAIWEHLGLRGLRKSAPDEDDYEENFIQQFTPAWLGAWPTIERLITVWRKRVAKAGTEIEVKPLRAKRSK